jgi:hypothetical protein
LPKKQTNMSKEKGPHAKDFLIKQRYDKRERANKWGKGGGTTSAKGGYGGGNLEGDGRHDMSKGRV